MAYCNLNDLIKRFGETEINDALDRDYDSVHDSQKLDFTIEDADNFINGYLGVRYTLPITGLQSLAIIRPIACDIVRYLLWSDSVPKEIEIRYFRAVTLLEKYRDLKLYLPDVSPAKQNPSGGVDFIANERIFSHDTLKGF